MTTDDFGGGSKPITFSSGGGKAHVQKNHVELLLARNCNPLVDALACDFVLVRRSIGLRQESIGEAEFAKKGRLAIAPGRETASASETKTQSARALPLGVPPRAARFFRFRNTPTAPFRSVATPKPRQGHLPIRGAAYTIW